MEERAVGIGRFQEVRSWKSYSHSPYYNHQDYYMLKDPLVAGVAFGGTSREVVETVYHEGRMRTLTDHIVSGDQAVQLTIEVTDEPGAGGANHLYMIRGFDTATNPSDPFKDRYGEAAKHSTVLFQNGPIKEVGVNGITQEALLAILIDRLRSFQAGPFSCRENAIALTHFEEGLMWLQRRTVARIKRGVEGTHEK